MSKEHKTATDGDPDAFVLPAGYTPPMEEGDPLRSYLIMRELNEAMDLAHDDVYVYRLYTEIERWYPVTESPTDYTGISVGDAEGDGFVVGPRKD